MPKKLSCIVSILLSCFLPMSAQLAVSQPSISHEALVFDPIFKGDIYLYETGRNHPISVVLVHGVGDEGATVWNSIVEQLSKKYHVVMFDLPGFGRSSKANALYSPLLYAAFVKHIVDRYVKGSFILIGHSLGGAVALRFAATYPRDLQRLILVDVAGILHRSVITKYMAYVQIDRLGSEVPFTPASFLKRLTGYTLERLQGLPLDTELVLGSPSMRQRVLDADPQKIAGLALVNEDFSVLLEKIRTPCLILWGAEDTITPLRTGRLLAEKIPNARLNIIQNVAHSPMLEQPEKFNRLILAELRASPKKPMQSERIQNNKGIGRCNTSNDVVFSGVYEHIEISDCKKVLLTGVTTEYVSVDGSEVTIESSHIKGGEIALRVSNSTLEATCVYMEADTAILTSGSHLDLAGVELVGRQAALCTDLESKAMFSISLIHSPHNKGYVHGIREVTLDNPL